MNNYGFRFNYKSKINFLNLSFFTILTPRLLFFPIFFKSTSSINTLSFSDSYFEWLNSFNFQEFAFITFKLFISPIELYRCSVFDMVVFNLYLIGFEKIKKLGKNSVGNGNETIQNENIFKSKSKKITVFWFHDSFHILLPCLVFVLFLH